MAEISDDNLQKAYRQYVAYRESEARYQRIEAILAVTVAAIIVLFVIATYFTVRSNYSAEKLSSRLTQELADLRPDITAALLEVGIDVLPLYADLAGEKFQAGLPDLERELSKEVEKLWGGIGNQVRDDFDAALERAGKRLEQRLQAEFPGILDEPGLAMLEKELTELLEDDAVDFVEEFFHRYSSDLNKLYETLEGFRPNRFERFDDTELAAYYIHLWLMLLDHEIMARD